MTVSYTHTQVTPSTTWTIEHNLECAPVADVVTTVNGAVHKVLPAAMIYIDENNVELQFSNATTGVVRLIGSYSLALRAAPGSIDPGAGHSAPGPDPDEYRFFRVRINSYVGQAVRFQSVQLMVGGTPYPTNTMTSNSAPAPLVATASSVFSTFEPYLAFFYPGGGSDTYRWIHALGAAAPQWIQIDLGAGNEITPTSIRLCPDSAAATDYPTHFTVLASNTGTFTGEEVMLFDSGTLTSANWTANAVSSFTLLSPPWSAEPSLWTQAGTDYWTLSGDLAVSATPAWIPSDSPALHGVPLAQGEYADVYLATGYSGDVGLLGVTDSFGPMVYTDTNLRFLAWYWSGLMLKEGGYGPGAPSALTGPQRYRIARDSSDTFYFSKVSADGSTLEGTIFSGALNAGFNAANVHVVLFGQYTPGAGYPAPSATAYPALTGTGGLYPAQGPSTIGFVTGETNAADGVPAIVQIQRTGDLSYAASIDWSLTTFPPGNTIIQPSAATGTANFAINASLVQITVELSNMDGESAASASMTLNTPSPSPDVTIGTASTDINWGGGGGA